jgi:hypothetical protein
MLVMGSATLTSVPGCGRPIVPIRFSYGSFFQCAIHTFGLASDNPYNEQIFRMPISSATIRKIAGVPAVQPFFRDARDRH